MMFQTKPDQSAVEILLRVAGFALIEGFNSPAQSREFLESGWSLLPQYDGRLENEVKAKDKYKDLPLSQALGGIGPHTEGVAYQVPPQYLALYCIKPAEMGGETCIYDGYRVFTGLNREHWNFCCNEHFDFMTEGNYAKERKVHSAKPMVTKNENNMLQFNFSSNFFRYGDVNPVTKAMRTQSEENNLLDSVVGQIMEQCERNKMNIRIPENSLLIWDNYRMLHGRNGFSDPERYLKRFWLMDRV